MKGPVFLAVAVDDGIPSLAAITEPDADAAPVAYDQTQIQGIVDLVNDTKQQHNALLLFFDVFIVSYNDLLDKLRDSEVIDTI